MSVLTPAEPASFGVEWRDTWLPRRETEALRVAQLPVSQRLLLTTDGSMTIALATLRGEPIGVRMIEQRMTVLAEDDDELSLWAGGEVLQRRVLLHGAESDTPLLLGVSRIVGQRLPHPARAALIRGDVAIGLVLHAHEIETLRVPLSVGVRPATDEAAHHLGAGLMCRRRYLIKAGGQPLMTVDEQFPAAGFVVGDLASRRRAAEHARESLSARVLVAGRAVARVSRCLRATGSG
jgi:chorismate-pyruvate lyase